MRFHFGCKALVGGLILALAGCEGSNPDVGGRVTLSMTDAPGDVLAAVVTITEINLQNNEGKVLLLDQPFTTNLVDLAGTTAVLAEDVPVPNGTYPELRFIITGAYLEVDNGDGTSSFFASSPDYEALPLGVMVGDLQMPSFPTSGLKVNFSSNPLLVDEDGHLVLVDFDVAKSFGHPAGNSGQWVMHPVISAVTQ